jgi:hypothetical protein
VSTALRSCYAFGTSWLSEIPGSRLWPNQPSQEQQSWDPWLTMGWIGAHCSSGVHLICGTKKKQGQRGEPGVPGWAEVTMALWDLGRDQP